ncbi:MAG: hypothetical protein M5T61_18660 [Acidimicrobiia bacterium]|nr:hypothetical protein [Acidimicrobiia bacterium]
MSDEIVFTRTVSAFTVKDDGSSYNQHFHTDLWIVDADGTNQRRLTGDPYWSSELPDLNQSPEWSPDGTQIVFYHADPAVGGAVRVTTPAGGLGSVVATPPSAPSTYPGRRPAA